MIADELKKKLNRLTEILHDYSPVAAALSGGVDSTFLLKHARDALGESVVAVTAAAPNFAPDETEDAVSFCAAEKINHILVGLGDVIMEIIAANPPDRCYFCKKSIFGTLLTLPALEGRTLIDGTNTDDAFDFRPGEKALEELGIKSPLREAGLSKAEIRAAAKEAGLNVWNKPALACLASRIPYGDEITKAKLRAVYSLEKLLRASGFVQVRVRHHGDIARIEVQPSEREKFFDAEFMDKINEAAQGAGFVYAALDLKGYRTGSLNPL